MNRDCPIGVIVSLLATLARLKWHRARLRLARLRHGLASSRDREARQ